MKYKKVLLKDIAEVIMGSSPKSEFYSDVEGTPFLQGTRTFGRMYPEIDTYTTKTTRMANKDDILFSVRAPVGDINFAPIDLCIGRGLSCIKPISVHKEFLYYLLIGNIRMYESKSTGTIFSSINKKELENLEFKIPSFYYQKKIGDFLWSIDSKIEVNNSIISNLEELAQTLFKRWFVDFEFPNEEGKPYKSSGGKMVESGLGMIPEGWEVSTIGKQIYFQNGHAFKSKDLLESPSLESYSVFKMGNIKKGGGINHTGTKSYYPKIIDESLKRFLLKKGDLLMCMTDMKNNVALLGHTALMDVDDVYLQNQRVGLLRSVNTNKIDYPFLYILTNSDSFLEDLRSRANSGVQVNLSTKEIKNSKMIVPNQEIHQLFNKKVKSMFEKIFSLTTENIKLNKLRDALLPKLLSGEIELPDDMEVTDDVPIS